MIETFGCQMNVADSENLADLLAIRGFTETSKNDEADLIIVNTCSVREKAESRAKARLREHGARKKKGALLWVIGCMAQNIGEALKKEIPGLNRVIGAPDLEYISFDIDSYLADLNIDEDDDDDEQIQQVRELSISRFIPIMRGCNNFCSYCIVPHVRGREHSIEALKLSNEIKKMAKNGVKEITLLGQNVNSYNDGDLNFPGLIRYIHNIKGIERVRFTTSHPKDMGVELIETIRDLPKLCTHIHLPVQSGSSEILDKMNRKYTREDYLEKIEIIKNLIPEADITTDAMVGFPGETDEQFQETLSLFQQVRYTTAYMFAYSVRTGTAAEKYEDQVSTEIKKERLKKLIDIQTEITKEKYASMVGKEGEALFTRRQDKNNHEWIGQDFGFKRVLLDSEDDLYGKITPFRVKSSTGMTLVAERI